MLLKTEGSSASNTTYSQLHGFVDHVGDFMCVITFGTANAYLRRREASVGKNGLVGNSLFPPVSLVLPRIVLPSLPSANEEHTQRKRGLRGGKGLRTRHLMRSEHQILPSLRPCSEFSASCRIIALNQVLDTSARTPPITVGTLARKGVA
jgi:hypothetical protein